MNAVTTNPRTGPLVRTDRIHAVARRKASRPQQPVSFGQMQKRIDKQPA
jgi:hypothetical protein